MKNLFVAVLVIILSVPYITDAHSGRTNAEGCHNNSKTGQYECHGTKTIVAKTETRSSVRTTARTSFADYNCADFDYWEDAQDFYKEAGGPLIDPHDLDRDRDGIACEALK